MRGSTLIPALLCVLAGLAVAAQSRINGELATRLDSGIEAATLSIVGGDVLLLLLLVVLPSVRRGLLEIPDAVRQGRLPWWALLGGIGGTVFLSIQSSVTPLLGVAVFSVAVVAGQTTSSLIVDRIGFGPAGKNPITAMRVVGALVGLAAVTLSVSDRLGSASFPVAAAGFAILAGAVTPPQVAANGRIAALTGQPLSAATVNFFVATAGLLLALAVTYVFFDHPINVPPAGPWWLYLGGPLGVAFIAIAAWAVKPLGLLLFTLLLLAGQLAGALLLDVFFPAPGTIVSWQLLAGVALTLVAAGLASIRR